MAIDVQYISLDISKQPTPQQVRLGQGDANATQLVVSVYDEGIAYDLTGYSVRLETRLPNSDTYYSVDGTRSGNVATFDIDETYAATSYGFDGFGYVDILSGDTVICSTSRFQLVVLQNAQEGADPSTSYSNGIREATERAIAAAEAAEGVVLQDVPLMSATVRGGAQLGTGLEITDGVLSVDSATVPIPTMSATTKGGAKLGAGLSVADDTLSLSGESYTSAEKTKLAGIEANANNYTLPTMDATTKGGAKLGDGLSIANDVLSVDASSVTSGTLPIAQGGTGATTASDARTNIFDGTALSFGQDTLTVDGTTNSYISLKYDNFTDNVAPSGSIEFSYVRWLDSAENVIGRINHWVNSGIQYMRYITQRKISGTTKLNILNLGVDSSGNAVVSVSGDNAAQSWRNALGAANKKTTVSNQSSYSFEIPAERRNATHGSAIVFGSSDLSSNGAFLYLVTFKHSSSEAHIRQIAQAGNRTASASISSNNLVITFSSTVYGNVSCMFS